VFIELTDHLRCPADHEEQFLVLLPSRLADRRVEEGELGCPVCGRTYPIEHWVADLGGTPAPAPSPRLTAEVMHTLLGLEGPGGAVVLVGGAAGDAVALRERLEGVHLVLVNAPEGIEPAPGLSLLLAPGIPLKARTVRGAVVGPDAASGRHWAEEAARVVLPGLRIVGEGPPPAREGGPEVMAEADGVWVARRGPG
jgi:uncharacterized protein YbaR (Trm112 family)